MILFLILLLVPVIEIILFIQLGGLIGVWTTVAIIFLTAAIGASVVRAQGLLTLSELQARLDAGADPSGPMAHGALLLVAGLLLVTPGFMTDAIGFLLLVPAVRAAVIRRISEHMVVHVAGARRNARGPGPQRDSQPGPRPDPRSSAPSDPTILEGEYEVIDEDEPQRRGTSGWTRDPRSGDPQ